MMVFLDFEASSLAKDSFPVEVAWVFEDGRSTSHLIKPLPHWTDWSEEAEAIHGLSRARLEADGVPVEGIANEMLRDLGGHDLYASSPSWDGKWLSVLLRGGGLPRHALRLKKSDDGFVMIARGLRPDLSDVQLAALVAKTIENTEPASPAHRALPDAILELERLATVRRDAAGWT